VRFARAIANGVDLLLTTIGSAHRNAASFLRNTLLFLRTP